MNIIFTTNGMSVGRDVADKPIYKESTVIHKLRQMLNQTDGIGTWKRFRPDRHGLTSSKIGIRNSKTGVIYWHERYQIECAAKAWRDGNLFLLKA